jgi:ELWxxDGT repeat protein
MRFFRTLLIIAIATIQTFAAGQLQRLADLNPGSVGSFPSNITVFANSVYFGGYTLETGRELFKYDGTNVTLAADINDTKDDLGGGTLEGNDSLPSWLTPFNGWLYFAAYEPRHGAELWSLQGTNIARVADINPDINDTVKPFPNSSWPSELTVFNNALYFVANSGAAIEDYELWKYDGATTSRVANIHPSIGTNYSSFPNALAVFNGALYFMANDGSHGFELWRFNETGTTMLSDINPGGPDSSSYPKKFTPFKNELIFTALRDDVGYEAWKTDGTKVALISDINAGAESSYPDSFTEFNGALYFRATDAMHGSELWKYDGNIAELAWDVNPGGNSFPKNLTAFGSRLIFAADDGVNGWELWRFDGANAQIVTNLNAAGDSFPENLIVSNGVLYFTATTPETGYEIWSYDGTNVTLAADINPGPGDSFPQFLTIFNGSLLFRATGDGLNDWELWSYTPSVSTTFTEPRNLTIERIGSEIRLQWISSAGSTNIVQAAADITGQFNDLSGPIIATGSGEVVCEFRLPIASETTRFFRIERL